MLIDVGVIKVVPYKRGLGSSLPRLSLTVELCCLETLLAAAASLNFALPGPAAAAPPPPPPPPG